MFADPAQSIYSFRSAVPTWFVEFATDANTQIYQLRNNYRSSTDICRCGTQIIAGAEWNISGAIVAAGENKSFVASQPQPEIRYFPDGAYAEAMGAIEWGLERAVHGGSVK